ncbi:MAG: exopolysaccharide biosynthesis polyprenyl glycosylphosphotransferase [bacterium]|nr:exopolysaccharide biosynthesis polyprenyl glycosylphosphotransferase [bacterium]
MKRISFLSIILLVGDILLFYGSLALTLLFRYGREAFASNWELHATPFSILLVLWITIFYIGGLYERKFLKATTALQEKIVRNMLAGGAIGAFLFYLIPYFGITPKTNLFIHILLLMILLGGWRMLIARSIANSFKIRILFFGASPDVVDMVQYLQTNPQFEYQPAGLMTLGDTPDRVPSDLLIPFNHNLPEVIRDRSVHLVVASADIKQNEAVVRMFYEILPLGISFMDFPTFYERLTGKIPVSLITEAWFLENLAQLKSPTHIFLKRALDITLALVGGVITLALFPIIAFLIKINSPGPILIRQTRIGKNKKEFTLVKFRSMIALSKDGLAEKEGALWAEEKDPRITRVGGFLRKTHLDELPQIWNILNNDISIVGPRPERAEIVTHLEEIIPYYAMRHLIKPGVTGWAQVSMPQVYAGSVEETLEKLQHDLYYIKHQNTIMDIAIILKTALLIATRRGR